VTNVPDRSRHDAHAHIRFGWWALLFFLGLGFVLELLHGFKIRLYLDVSNETRRLMWTLAHAHGALLGLIHILFGLTVLGIPGLPKGTVRLVSRCLVAASVLLPGGFFLGGVSFYSGDPGVGIALAPVGAISLIIAVSLTARAVSRALPTPDVGRVGERTDRQ